MKKNLEEYIKVYHDWFDRQCCEQSVKEMENLEWQQHTFYNPDSNTSTPINGNQELDVAFNGSNLSTQKYIVERIWEGYYKYVTELNFVWFGGWSGYSLPRFNRYKETTKMASHCDHIHTLFDGTRKGVPTLSFVAALNNNYEGGEFIMFEDVKIDFKVGTALIFPSCFLYPHRVEPVVKGVRYSCVSWAW